MVAYYKKFNEFTNSAMDVIKEVIARHLQMLVDDIKEVEPKLHVNEVRGSTTTTPTPTLFPSPWTRYPLLLLVSRMLTRQDFQGMNVPFSLITFVTSTYFF